MPGWKLPVAYGILSPIFNETFWPSEARTCGDCITRVEVSDITACSNAPGKVVEKSRNDIFPICEREIAPGVVVVDVVVVGVTVGVPGVGGVEAGVVVLVVAPREK